MKAYESEPDFYSMSPLLVGEGSNLERSDGSSFNLNQTMGQSTDRNPTDATSVVPHYPSSLLTPRTITGHSFMSKNELPRTVSLDEQICCSRSSSEGGESSYGGSIDDVTSLNQSSYIHELAMVCATLCNLRKATNFQG